MPGNIRLWGTSGYVELAAPNTATNQVLTLPTDSVQPGMVLISSQGVSGGSTVSFNNVFSSSYENYRIEAWFTTSSAIDLRMRLRSVGTDNSNSSYHYGGIRTTSAGTVNGYGGGGQNYWGVVSATGTNLPAVFSIDVLQPQTANFTVMSGTGSGYAGGVAQYSGEYVGGQFIATTSFDGFTVYPSSGTISGSIRVYGYRNS